MNTTSNLEPTRQEAAAQEVIPAGVARARLAEQAAALRVQGATIQQAAQSLGVTPSKIVRLLARHYRRQAELTTALASGAFAEEEDRLRGVIRTASAVMKLSERAKDRLAAGMTIIRASESRRDLLAGQGGIVPVGTASPVSSGSPLPHSRPFADIPQTTDEQRRDAVLRLFGVPEWEIGKLHGHGA